MFRQDGHSQQTPKMGSLMFLSLCCLASLSMGLAQNATGMDAGVLPAPALNSSSSSAMTVPDNSTIMPGNTIMPANATILFVSAAKPNATVPDSKGANLAASFDVLTGNVSIMYHNLTVVVVGASFNLSSKSNISIGIQGSSLSVNPGSNVTLILPNVFPTTGSGSNSSKSSNSSAEKFTAPALLGTGVNGMFTPLPLNVTATPIPASGDAGSKLIVTGPGEVMAKAPTTDAATGNGRRLFQDSSNTVIPMPKMNATMSPMAMNMSMPTLPAAGRRLSQDSSNTIIPMPKMNATMSPMAMNMSMPTLPAAGRRLSQDSSNTIIPMPKMNATMSPMGMNMSMPAMPASGRRLSQDTPPTTPTASPPTNSTPPPTTTNSSALPITLLTLTKAMPIATAPGPAGNLSATLDPISGNVTVIYSNTTVIILGSTFNASSNPNITIGVQSDSLSATVGTNTTLLLNGAFVNSSISGEDVGSSAAPLLLSTGPDGMLTPLDSNTTVIVSNSTTGPVLVVTGPGTMPVAPITAPSSGRRLFQSGMMKSLMNSTSAAMKSIMPANMTAMTDGMSVGRRLMKI